MASTWHTSRLRVSCIPVFFSRLYHQATYPLSHSFSLSFSLFSLSIPFSFYFVSHFSPHTARASKYLRTRTLFRILPSRRTLTSQPRRADAEHEGTEVVCAIVVSRLLFPGNFTSFTNYPPRAHAVRKWRCSPDGKEGDGAREWRRNRLIFSHRINPAPASRRGLILHGGCRRPCVSG